MPVAFRPIRSKKLRLPLNTMPQVENELRRFVRIGTQAASRYPAQRAARPRVSKTGKRLKPRPRYRRTNSLARSWSAASNLSGRGDTLTARVISSPSVAPYNIYVIGPKTGRKGRRQARVMGEKGWQNAPELLDDIWERRVAPRLAKLIVSG